MINTIGPNITRLREQRGLTIRDLAFKTNIAENSLSSIEHGKKGVGLKTVVKIADALNCSLDFLVGRTSDPHPFHGFHGFHGSKDESVESVESVQSADKAQFLAIMSDLYDKYFKLPTLSKPSALSKPSTLTTPSALATADTETIDADDSVGKDIKDIKDSKDREEALSSLKRSIESGGGGCGGEWKEPLWTCVRLYQGEEFRTAGRGKMHSGSTAFTYELKKSSRNGLETGELIISTRKQAKTITRSSVELALKNALEVMEKEGIVRGPKKLGQVFGGSYLYAMFLSWGVIKGTPE